MLRGSSRLSGWVFSRLEWTVFLGLLVVAGLWVLLVWLSTLYARAHWPTDLLAGGGVGLAWLVVCIATWRQPPSLPPSP